MAERQLLGGGQAKEIYGKGVFCVAKRQLSRRELRKFGLANALLPGGYVERRVNYPPAITH